MILSNKAYPLMPVIAVAGIIFNDRDEVVLIQRGSEPRKGKWSIPGGSVELGEELGQALVREVEEECSLKVEPGPFVSLIERIEHDSRGKIRYHYAILDFVCKYKEGVLTAGSDAADAKWVSMADIENMPLTDELKQIIKKAFDMFVSWF